MTLTGANIHVQDCECIIKHHSNVDFAISSKCKALLHHSPYPIFAMKNSLQNTMQITYFLIASLNINHIHMLGNFLIQARD